MKHGTWNIQVKNIFHRFIYVCTKFHDSDAVAARKLFSWKPEAQAQLGLSLSLQLTSTENLRSALYVLILRIVQCSGLSYMKKCFVCFQTHRDFFFRYFKCICFIVKFSLYTLCLVYIYSNVLIVRIAKLYLRCI